MFIHGVHDGNGRRQVPHRLQQLTEDLPVFDIQNVAEYYHRFVYTGERNWTVTDMPNAAPPFDHFWMEFTLHSAYFPDAPATPLPPIRYGLDIEMVDHEDPTLAKYEDPIEKADVRRLYQQLYAGKQVVDGPALDPATLPTEPAARAQAVWRAILGFAPVSTVPRAERGDWAWYLRDVVPVRWQLVIHLYEEEPKGNIHYQLTALVFVRPDGTIYDLADDGWISLYPACSPEKAQTPLVRQAMERAVGSVIVPSLLAVSFLHCKNVQVQRIDPPAKLARARQRQHGRAPVRFHELEITPMQRILETEGRIQQTGLRQALHICRGHFKTYTDERRLFGRHTGTYWWSSQVRGAVEEGIVDKDYNVQSPPHADAEES